MRAPPESLSPITGMPSFRLWSWILQIFFAWARPSEPPSTVKSCENTPTGRPSTRPKPVTTPSPGNFFDAMPKWVAECSTNMSISSKEPSSTRSAMRSRAVILPAACWRATFSGPPPSSALRRSLSRLAWRSSDMGHIINSQLPNPNKTPSSFAGRKPARRRRPAVAPDIRCAEEGNSARTAMEDKTPKSPPEGRRSGDPQVGSWDLGVHWDLGFGIFGRLLIGVGGGAPLAGGVVAGFDPVGLGAFLVPGGELEVGPGGIELRRLRIQLEEPAVVLDRLG